MTDYIVIQHQIIGNPTEWDDVFSWDGARYPSTQRAIGAGMRRFDHDDFNVGHVEGDRLVWFGWQYEQLDEDLAAVAAQLGLRAGGGS